MKFKKYILSLIFISCIISETTHCGYETLKSSIFSYTTAMIATGVVGFAAFNLCNDSMKPLAAGLTIGATQLLGMAAIFKANAQAKLFEKKYADQTTNNNDLLDTNKQQLTTISSLTTQLENLNQKKSTDISSSMSSVSTIIPENQILVYQNKINTLKAENTALKTKLEKLQKENTIPVHEEEFFKVLKRITYLEKENKELHASLTQAKKLKTEENDDIRNERDALRKEIEILKQLIRLLAGQSSTQENTQPTTNTSTPQPGFFSRLFGRTA